MTKLFSITSNRGYHEFCVVFMGPSIGFAGKVNGATICTGDWEDVREQIVLCFEFNEEERQGLN